MKLVFHFIPILLKSVIVIYSLIIKGPFSTFGPISKEGVRRNNGRRESESENVYGYVDLGRCCKA